jgi:pimeloyl-ACP methyl ester carboxylesterase
LDGLAFHYRETGDPTAPPLVALHALGSDARTWDAVAVALSDRYRLLALDQRGHGESARPGVYSFELMRDDLARFADALSLRRLTLLGHSMGGTVAYLFAEEWPERLDRLIIEDTPPPSGGPPREVPAEPPEPVPFDWRLVGPISRQLSEPDQAWWERLSKITAPTLIVAGGTTSPIPADQLAEVARKIPVCRLVTVEGAGHRVHETKPDAFLDVVRGFLAGDSSQGDGGTT